MQHLFKVGGSLLAAVLIAACSQGPSDPDIENLVSGHVSVPNVVEISDFSVTNLDQDGEFFTADVSYTVRYLQGSEEIYQHASENALAEDHQESAAVHHAAVAAVKAGEELQVSQTVQLEKKDGEWHLRQDND